MLRLCDRGSSPFRVFNKTQLQTGAGGFETTSSLNVAPVCRFANEVTATPIIEYYVIDSCILVPSWYILPPGLIAGNLLPGNIPDGMRECECIALLNTVRTTLLGSRGSLLTSLLPTVLLSIGCYPIDAALPPKHAVRAAQFLPKRPGIAANCVALLILVAACMFSRLNTVLRELLKGKLFLKWRGNPFLRHQVQAPGNARCRLTNVVTGPSPTPTGGKGHGVSVHRNSRDLGRKVRP